MGFEVGIYVLYAGAHETRVSQTKQRVLFSMGGESRKVNPLASEVRVAAVLAGGGAQRNTKRRTFGLVLQEARWRGGAKGKPPWEVARVGWRARRVPHRKLNLWEGRKPR